MNFKEHLPQFLKLPRPPKAVLITAIVIIGVGVLVSTAGTATHIIYANRVLPNVSYAGMDLSGMDRLAVTQRIQSKVNAMLERGIPITVEGRTEIIALQTTSEDVDFALVDINVSSAVDAALAAGRESGPASLLHGLWLATVGSKKVSANITLNAEKFNEAVRTAFPDVEDPGTAADFVIAIDHNGDTEITTTAPSNGKALALPEAWNTIVTDATDLYLEPLTINVVPVVHPVSEDEAKTLYDAVRAAISAAPYTLTYTPETRTEPRTWDVTTEQLADWLVPQESANGVTLGLDTIAMQSLLQELHAAIDIAPENARFAMEANTAVEFSPSRDGVAMNDEQTLDALTGALGITDANVIIVVDRQEPEITTADVNNLGITEPLGTGVSGYGGSPGNRITNIKNGMSKLNGMLVAPGEVVSLINKLGPFTTAAGYLPELVIKGDEIKPEIGGGLCQIGSTTFRAVMNSGLKVFERRNHSLVVNYYNDLSNGNPGTDATIYDPAPDFKFQNDTANYILLVTEMDESEKMLYFTFWGTSDGRKGSYEPPQILSWSGYGATQYKETTTLAPGVTRCQAPHPGATTTFTYTVDYTDGTNHEEEFFSSYRSLPQICLVGKSADTSTEEGTDPTDSGSSEAPPDSADEAVPVE